MPLTKKNINVVIPVFNEKDNIRQICDAILDIFKNNLSMYDCKILFIDNYSTDGTRDIIDTLCSETKLVKAIFNSRNFGPIRSPFHGLISSDADIVIQMAADFQDPPNMIVNFVKKWEEGFKIVIAKKISSKENPLMYFFRSKYYDLLKKIADIEHIEHFTGYGLYDKAVVDALRSMNDPYPYLRGMISEVGFNRAEITFDQPKRMAGKTKTNFLSLYEYAMLGITSYSKILMRLATIIGFFIAGISLAVALVYFIVKIIFWNSFPMGSAPILIGVFAFGSIQLFFIGLLGEYVLNINTRIMHRPLVIEEKRVNFE